MSQYIGNDPQGNLPVRNIVATNKNYLINPTFEISQRGTAGALSTSTSFIADRWISAIVGTGTWIQLDKGVRISAGTGLTYGWLSQRVESVNAKNFVGDTAVVTVKINTNTQTSLTLVLAKPTVKDDFSSRTNSTISDFIHTGSGEETFSIVVPASDLADAANGFGIRFNLPNGLADGQAIDFLEVKLEPGSVPTPFEYPDYATELAKCQRYYIDSTFTGGWTMFPALAGTTGSGARYTLPVQFPVTMRNAPSITVGTLTNANTPTAGDISKHGTRISGISTVGVTSEKQFAGYTADAEL